MQNLPITTTAVNPASASPDPAVNPAELIHDKRPKVQLPGDNHLVSDCAREIGKILASMDIFSRGGSVFVINERGDGLMRMTPEMLRTWIENYLVCYRVHEVRNGQPVIFRRTLSQSDAAAILVSPQFIEQLQQIERFNPVRMPVIDRWGYCKLLLPGCDEFTRSFTFDTVPILENLPVEGARMILDELLGEFVFADKGRSKAVAIAAMLTVFGRALLPAKALRPCFIVLANAEGAGKTLLVKCATVPVLGYAPASTKPSDEDEMRKALLCAVIEAKPTIFFDNVRKHISSDALEGFLTTPDYEGRILGQSASFRGQNDAVVFITGNGCTVSPDMRRRSLFCELFLEVERAEDRVFQNNLEVPALLQQRQNILSALFSLIRDWDAAGRPKPSRTNSSFPDWSEVFGGIVENAGYGCPLETPQIEAAADQTGTDMRTLVKILADGAKLRAVEFSEVVEVARSGGLFEWLIPEDGDLEAKGKATFARLLKGYDRRLVGGYRFTLLGRGHCRRYKVEEVTPQHGDTVEHGVSNHIEK
jgi:hypothetical protein